MTRQSHIIIGATSAYLIGLPVLPALIGSVLPDIDLKWNKKTRRTGLLFSHRGITHHVILVILVGILAWLINNPWFSGLVVGYASHIASDMMTKQGVPYWKHKDRASFMLFKTGTISEHLFVIVFIIISMIYAVNFSKPGLPYDANFIASRLTDAFAKSIHVERGQN